MTKPVVPSPAAIVGAGQVKLVETRPKAFDFVNYGRGNYATVFEGLKAQVTTAVAHLADGVTGANLKLSRGDQLKALIASEFAMPPATGPTKSVGYAVLTRTGTLLAGSIRKGHRFRRDAEPTKPVALTSADYEADADVAVVAGQATVTVPIVAVRAGVQANTPYFVSSPYRPLVLADAPFDTAFAVTSYTTGGGSDGFDDAALVRYARAYAVGRFGPTNDSAILAALGAGVRHLLVQDPSPDGTTLYISDPTWGGSPRWANVVRQSMQDSGYIGNGCKVTVVLIDNTLVNVTLTVRLRETSAFSDTSDIDTAIQKTVRSYFDDRPDFNVYSTQALRGVVSRADKRILRCTSASINTLAGTPLTYSAPFFGHLYLADNAVTTSYLGPV